MSPSSPAPFKPEGRFSSSTPAAEGEVGVEKAATKKLGLFGWLAMVWMANVVIWAIFAPVLPIPAPEQALPAPHERRPVAVRI